MKKAIIAMVSALILTAVLGINSVADTDSDEYLIKGDGDSCTLYAYQQGTPTEIAVGTLGDLLPLTSGGRVTLDDVSTKGRILIPAGSYILSGTLRSDGDITVPEGAHFVLHSLAVSFTGEYGMHIRGGEVTMSSGRIISAQSSAVSLEYSGASTFTMYGGSLSSSSEQGTVNISCGVARLLSGEITNTAGCAVYSDASFTLGAALSGVGYDLITYKPMHLTDGYSPASPVRIQYSASFERGGLYAFIYGAKDCHTAAIRLFDRDGREEPVTYFSSHPSLPEDNFLAVYKPFYLKLHIGNSVSTYDILRGDSITPDTPECPTGYGFGGWYTDRELTTPYASSSVALGDTDLYADFRLLPPAFTISSLDFVYDGRSRLLTFSSLYHPLDGDGGIYSFLWEKDGKPVSESRALNLTSCSDSGIYTCTVTYRHGIAFSTVVAEGITVSIKPQAVPLPSPDPVRYTGDRISCEIPPSQLYSSEITSGIDTGSYPVVLTLSDPQNYVFLESTSPTATIYYSIEKADNYWQNEPLAFDIYQGNSPNISAKSRFGEVKILYSSSLDGEYTSAAPINPGTYYVKAYVTGNSNYSSLESSPIPFSIIGEEVDHLTLLTPPILTEYYAFDTLVADGVSVLVTYNSGRTETVGADKLSVSYQQGLTMLYGDNAVILSYLGGAVPCPVGVRRASYDLSSLVFSSATSTFSAAYQTVTPTLNTVIGLDGIPLEYSVSGGGVNVGEYSVTLTFSTDSPNYNTPPSITAKLEIVPYQAEITWQNTEFVYNGKLQHPTASYIDIHGATRFPNVSGAGINASCDYIATAIPTDPNYVFTSDTCPFVISRADLDISGVYWSDDEFDYSSSPHSVTVHGLPEGISVVGYIDATETTVGEYTATAILTYDSANYNPPPTLTHSWCIRPLVYPTDSFFFADSSVIFDGEVHYPVAVGELPVSIDGYPLEYSFLGGATHVADGRVPVTVVFSSADPNYTVPPSTVAYVEILPLGISVSWSGVEFTYSGSVNCPVASSPLTDIQVLGAQINAGHYTATAISLDKDYTVLNPEYSFTVLQAENFWLSPVVAQDIFEGRAPDVIATAHFGTPTVTYYLDSECTRECYPSSPGVYYAVAFVPESTNYLPLRSSAVRMQVIAVVPVSLRAALVSDTLKAYTRLSDTDVTLYLAYNDGTEEKILLSSATVIYQHADSLRRADTHVTFSYMGFTAGLPITVGYAEYDLSGAYWSDDTFVYDTLYKLPTLRGLPEGVKVGEYSIPPVTDAGIYTVAARLDYDSENYLEPTVPPLVFTVLPMTLSVPGIDSREYDGHYYVPLSPSGLYDYIVTSPGREAGVYSLVIALTDKQNYVFEDGSLEVGATYEITPRVLSFTVSDFDLYLWESDVQADFVMSDGEIVDGDELALTTYVSDGLIYLTSANPNYRLSVSLGRVNRLNYPSPETTAMIVISVLLLLALLLFAAVIYSERDRIADYFAILRYRLSRPVSVGASGGTVGDSLESGMNTPPDRDGDSDDLGEYSPPIHTYPDTEPFDEDFTDSDSYSNRSDADSIHSDADTDSCETEIHRPDTAWGCSRTPISDSATTAVDPDRADELITDSLAKNLLKRGRETVTTEGDGRGVINVDTLSTSFSPGDRVDVNVLKAKSLIPYDTAYLKVLARGVIDKPLSVYANDFSLSAIKMIALTGGEAIRVTTRRLKGRNHTRRR